MVEPQGEGPLVPGLGAELVAILLDRRHTLTLIRYHDGQEELVHNAVMRGRDIGDLWEHIVLEPEPPIPGGGSIFLQLSCVLCLIDPETGAVLAEQTPAPGEL
jgi:hypothetical protein